VHSRPIGRLFAFGHELNMRLVSAWPDNALAAILTLDQLETALFFFTPILTY
jgi:hypothetical protein